MAPMDDCVRTDPSFQRISAESSPKEIKKLKKPLDKLPKVRYNKDTKKKKGNNKNECN